MMVHIDRHFLAAPKIIASEILSPHRNFVYVWSSQWEEDVCTP